MDITEYVEYLDRINSDSGWDDEDQSSWPIEDEDNG
jgi:hypothetical protein